MSYYDDKPFIESEQHVVVATFLYCTNVPGPASSSASFHSGNEEAKNPFITNNKSVTMALYMWIWRLFFLFASPGHATMYTWGLNYGWQYYFHCCHVLAVLWLPPAVVLLSLHFWLWTDVKLGFFLFSLPIGLSSLFFLHDDDDHDDDDDGKAVIFIEQ